MNEYVQNKVNAPGLALTVFGGGTLVFSLVMGLWQLFGVVRSLMAAGGQMDFLVAILAAQGWQLGLTIITLFCAIVVLLAGTRLRQARSPGLVYFGTILAMLPCCTSYCCCLGLPLGIWAIIVMQDDEVKAAFAEV